MKQKKLSALFAVLLLCAAIAGAKLASTSQTSSPARRVSAMKVAREVQASAVTAPLEQRLEPSGPTAPPEQANHPADPYEALRAQAKFGETLHDSSPYFEQVGAAD